MLRMQTTEGNTVARGSVVMVKEMTDQGQETNTITAITTNGRASISSQRAIIISSGINAISTSKAISLPLSSTINTSYKPD